MSPNQEPIGPMPVGPTPEQGIIPAPPEQIMPLPEAPVASVAPAPASEMITVPADIRQQVDQQRATQEAEFAQRQVEAAQTAIGMPPGYVAPEQPAPAAPQSTQGGRFGLGVQPAPMPADPSHTPGWDGQVRR